MDQWGWVEREFVVGGGPVKGERDGVMAYPVPPQVVTRTSAATVRSFGADLAAHSLPNMLEKR
jgi:hypothetical protein